MFAGGFSQLENLTKIFDQGKVFSTFLKYGRSGDVCWFRWRVLALKVKFGLGANFLAVKKRNLNDISTFIDQETEVVNYYFHEHLEMRNLFSSGSN